ncbi:MAG: hypothetical protein V9G42_07690 [Bacteroidia bacterium]
MKNVHSKSQIIIFDIYGNILKSCDTIFLASNLIGKNIMKQFPLLNCYEPEIRNLKRSNKPFFVPCIAFSFADFKSICDFVFIKHEEMSETTISWMISDNYVHFKERLNKPTYHPQIKTTPIVPEFVKRWHGK